MKCKGFLTTSQVLNPRLTQTRKREKEPKNYVFVILYFLAITEKKRRDTEKKILPFERGNNDLAKKKEHKNAFVQIVMKRLVSNKIFKDGDVGRKLYQEPHLNFPRLKIFFIRNRNVFASTIFLCCV
jgi:hypothetical protein